MTEENNVTEENNKLQSVDDMNMATLMEDVGSESGSQNGLQGVNVDDSAHENEGTMVTLEEAHSSGCSYHKQTVSITVTVKSVSFL